MSIEDSVNVAAWADRNIASFGSYDALVFGDRVWKSTELHDQSCRLAAALLALGFAAGDRAVLVFPNTPELVIAHAAVLRAGGVIVLVAHTAASEEIARLITHSGATAVLAMADCAAKVTSRSVRLRILAGPTSSSLLGEWQRFDDLVKHHAPLQRAVPRAAADLAEIVYTSGTTDKPKGVVHTHGSLDARRSYLTLGRVATELAVLPLTHGFGGRLFLRRLLLKLKLILMDHFDPDLVLDNIERHKLRVIQLVPSMCEALIVSAGLRQRDLSSLQMIAVSGAFTTESLRKRVQDALKAPVSVAYGMTEMPAMTLASPRSKPGAVGRLLEGVKARIIDEHGVEAPLGSVGTVEVKAPWAFSGYYNEPEETARAIHDGWTRTGDLGYFDAELQLYLVGRSKDLISQGAVKIFPRELELLIARLPDVRECAVVGGPDSFLGEAATAFVVVANGSQLTAEDVLTYCRAHLDPRKSPARVRFVRELPKSDLGKIKHAELRSLLAKENEAKASASVSAPLVVVRSGKKRTPLFFIHPAGGELTAYGPLFSLLHEDQPVYGIQSRARRVPECEHATLEAMAIDYASVVQSVQERGPYKLIGWSMGAVVAHAVAGELERRGEAVEQLSLIDPFVGRDAGATDDVFSILTAIYSFHPLPPPMRPLLRALDQRESGGTPTVAWCEEHGVLPKGAASQQELDAKIGLFEVHRRLVLTHQPRICKAPLTVLWAAGRANHDAWASRTTAAVRERSIGGDHFTIMFPPHVAAVAAALAEMSSDAAAQSEVAAEDPTSATRARVRSAEIADEQIAVLETHLCGVVARMVKKPVETVSATARLKQLGVTSVMTVALKDELEAHLKIPVATAALFAYPTIKSLAAYLHSELPKGAATPSAAAAVMREAASAVRVETASVTRTNLAPNPHAEPIALVGMAHRFPGVPTRSSTFWDLLAAGHEATREVPVERWDASRYYDSDSNAPLKSTTRSGSFLVGDISEFDAPFFEIAPLEAQAMDPQQRLILEVAWEAIAHAGATIESLQARSTGVFLGLMTGDYSQLASVEDLSQTLLPYWTTGISSSVAAGRVSYVWGLNGPSLAVDTACSSSLVAMHLACEALRAGTCDVALTGGVSVMLSPTGMILGSKITALSRDGRCKTFDASGDGFGRGEGCGVVVLKRLQDAERDGDRVLAVIRGTAVNQDGASSGLTVPNPIAQARVIEAALRDGHVEADAVQYVEAHGTGTVLGDPVEVDGLTRVFGARKGARLRIGSVKTNIGHLEAAAGVAGVIKTVLAIQHRELPASLHFKNPNPHIPWSEIPIDVQTKLGAWPSPEVPLIAGVSSFGLSGTNAHVVLEEASGEPAEKWAPADALAGKGQTLLLPISAKTPEALRAYAKRYADTLETAGVAHETYRDVAYTASCRQTHLPHRLAVVGKNRREWAERLRAYCRGESGAVVGEARERRSKIAFVFSGQGSQWWGMGRQLLQSDPIFRAAIETCAVHIDAQASWKLLEELGRDEATTRLGDTEIAQPALFALQVGLCAVWKSWGIEPNAVAGHSVGEIAAAYVAGALTLEAGCRLAVTRGRIMQKATGLGKMASVALSATEVAKLIVEFPGVEVAASNGPTTTVLSGEPEALKRALELMSARGVACKALRVNYAFHSVQVEELGKELTTTLREGWEPKAPDLRLISTVTGAAAPALDATYWGEQVRRQVRFYEATKTLIEEGYELFVEVGPHPVLLPAIDQSLEESGKTATLIPSLKRNEPDRDVMLEGLGGLHCVGCAVDWKKQYEVRGRIVTLPSYPWQRERFWLEGHKSRQTERIAPLLHRLFEAPDEPGKRIFELDLDLTVPDLKYLADHKVMGEVWFPGAAFIELALEAGKNAYGERFQSLMNVRFERSLSLSPGESRQVQVVLRPEQDGKSSFCVYSRGSRENEKKLNEPIEHARGVMRLGPEQTPALPVPTMLELEKRCQRLIPLDELYEGFAEGGMNFGPAFRGLKRLRAGDGEALGELSVSPEIAPGVTAYQVHPALLDACFQSGVGTRLSRDDAEAAVPTAVDEVRVFGSSAHAAWAYVKARSVEAEFVIDVWMLDDQGRVLVEARGLRAESVDARGKSDRLDRWLYEVQWREAARGSVEVTDGNWLIFAEQGGVGDALRAQLEERGAKVVSVRAGRGYARHDPTHLEVDPGERAQIRTLLDEAYATATPTRIVHLWSLDTASAARTDLKTLEDAQRLGCISVLHLTQELTRRGWQKLPRLILTTRGAQPARVPVQSPAQSALWGFGASLCHEYPELETTLIDLDEKASAEILYQEVTHADRENRIALRGHERLVARLVHHHRSTPSTVSTELTVGTAGYRIDVQTVGSLDSIGLRRTARREPRRGEVEVRVSASGVNFRDVLMAMGLYPETDASTLSTSMGGECAGIVTRVGDGVEGLRVGDEVIGAAEGLFSAYATLPVHAVWSKPKGMTRPQAASLSVIFGTVLYALKHVGGLHRGERVLIHSAAGGVGLAALQYAKHVGAEVIATAGTDEKRRHLRKLGIEHVFDSRSAAWANETMRVTSGHGVDVVLNSLAGEAIPMGLSVLAPCGRFLEIGKRDIYENAKLGLYALRNNLSISAVALDGLMRDRPTDARKLIEEVLLLFEAGTFEPVPVEVFPVSRASDAFQYMAAGKHIGKIVLEAEDCVRVRDDGFYVNPELAYLITGGLGGLGLVAARRLVERGARHVVLMGRGEPSTQAKHKIAEIQKLGAQTKIVRADVADAESLRAGLESIAASMPRLGGIVHAAGVLQDSVIDNLDDEKVRNVMASKMRGVWNLHALTKDVALDFFVSFSSVAGVLGAPGQAHYAAANGFLDGFAHWRHGQGLRAQSVDWGGWAEAGMLTRSNGVQNPTSGGGLMTNAEGAELFERVLQDSGNPQVTVADVRARQWRQRNPQASAMPLLDELVGESPSSPAASTNVLQKLKEVPESQRLDIVEQYLRATIAQLLHASPERIHRDTLLKTLGLDSLTRISVRNHIGRDLGFTPPTSMLAHAGATTGLLATAICKQLLQTTLTPNTDLNVMQPASRPVEQDRADRTVPLLPTQLGGLPPIPHGGAQEFLMPPLVAVLDVEGPANVARVTEALRVIGERHEALRSFPYSNGSGWVQRIRSTVHLSVQHGRIDSQDQLRPLVVQLAAAYWDISSEPTVRCKVVDIIGTKRHAIVIVLNHFAADATSMAILLDELETIYTALTNGRMPALPRIPIPVSEWATHMARRTMTTPDPDAELSKLLAQVSAMPDVAVSARRIMTRRMPRPRCGGAELAAAAVNALSNDPNSRAIFLFGTGRPAAHDLSRTVGFLMDLSLVGVLGRKADIANGETALIDPQSFGDLLVRLGPASIPKIMGGATMVNVLLSPRLPLRGSLRTADLGDDLWLAIQKAIRDRTALVPVGPVVTIVIMEDCIFCVLDTAAVSPIEASLDAIEREIRKIHDHEHEIASR